ncbi:FecR/PupR family sigma factor regulator [Caballeronia mineralivorans]|uniref:FecR/PupR family sigma factor regulator n=1 Tax=Caballeronia mineralivorans TaxID=2010198 RepID=UPI00094FA4A6|nr:DUF4880 domain-containing protein [Caballeronia mineralivorans]
MRIPDASASRSPTKAVSDRIKEGAIHWLLWLRSGGATPADLDAFRRWRAQSDEHARVAHDVMWVWNTLGVLGGQDCAACVKPRGRRNGRADTQNRNDGGHGSNHYTCRSCRSAMALTRRRRGG